MKASIRFIAIILLVTGLIYSISVSDANARTARARSEGFEYLDIEEQLFSLWGMPTEWWKLSDTHGTKTRVVGKVSLCQMNDVNYTDFIGSKVMFNKYESKTIHIAKESSGLISDKGDVQDWWLTDNCFGNTLVEYTCGIDKGVLKYAQFLVWCDKGCRDGECIQ